MPVSFPLPLLQGGDVGTGVAGGGFQFVQFRGKAFPDYVALPHRAAGFGVDGLLNQRGHVGNRGQLAPQPGYPVAPLLGQRLLQRVGGSGCPN